MDDKKLLILKDFIFTLANFKIAFYYINKGNFEESRKYFIKAHSKTKYADSAKEIPICSETIDSIKNNIKKIEKSLYRPPYVILFGRAVLQKNIKKHKKKKSQLDFPITQDFYEGFGEIKK